jgi:hypothetical protein
MGEASAGLRQDAARITITSVKDIRAAAEALRDIAWDRASLRVGVTDNIASKNPLADEDGAILASEVFGWNGPTERWWADTRLALSSPLPRACRYESSPSGPMPTASHPPAQPLSRRDDLSTISRSAR